MIYDGWATDDTEVTEDHEVIFHLLMTPIILSHHRVHGVPQSLFYFSSADYTDVFINLKG